VANPKTRLPSFIYDYKKIKERLGDFPASPEAIDMYRLFAFSTGRKSA
jgi:hypothetical protein